MVAQVYAHHIFASFIKTLADQLQRIEGSTTYRKVDFREHKQYFGGKPLTNTFLRGVAKIFRQCELGTEEEAYVCIIPPFKKLLPKVDRDEEYEED